MSMLSRIWVCVCQPLPVKRTAISVSTSIHANENIQLSVSADCGILERVGALVVMSTSLRFDAIAVKRLI